MFRKERAPFYPKILAPPRWPLPVVFLFVRKKGRYETRKTYGFSPFRSSPFRIGPFRLVPFCTLRLRDCPGARRFRAISPAIFTSRHVAATFPPFRIAPLRSRFCTSRLPGRAPITKPPIATGLRERRSEKSRRNDARCRGPMRNGARRNGLRQSDMRRNCGMRKSTSFLEKRQNRGKTFRKLLRQSSKQSESKQMHFSHMRLKKPRLHFLPERPPSVLPAQLSFVL